MFWQTFITAYAIAMGIISAAITVLLVAAFFYWIVMNLKEKFASKPIEGKREDYDDWPHDGPIKGFRG